MSYDYLLAISTETANSACSMYEEEGVVCPQKLSKHIFITAVNNVDHDPISTTATDSFHGTSISMMQHLIWIGR